MPAYAKKLATSGLTLTALVLPANPNARSAGPQVIELTKTPCQIGFWQREADCDWRKPLDKLARTSVSGGGQFRR